MSCRLIWDVAPSPDDDPAREKQLEDGGGLQFKNGSGNSAIIKHNVLRG